MQAIQAKAVSPPQNNYSALSERELRRVAEFVGRWVGRGPPQGLPRHAYHSYFRKG